jgi:WD40 repeat protein
MRVRAYILPAVIFVAVAARSPAQQPPSYARHVRPFLAKYCLECHNRQALKGGLDLETYKGLRAGGDGGEVLVPGRPDDSRIVLLVEGKDQPKMPPKKAKFHPKGEEIGVLRAWVATGARDDSGAVKIVLPNIKSRVPASAAVTALAYSSNGRYLAAAAYRLVYLLNPQQPRDLDALKLDAPATALAFCPASSQLAVAVGIPGVASDLLIYTLPGQGGTAQALTPPRRIPGAHQDVIQHLAYSPDGKLLATCSYDRQIKLWDTNTWDSPRTLREHSDSVYSVAFSPDGKLLASGAADRAVKVYEAATGKLLYTLGEPTDWVYAVAFSPDGKHLAAAGVDKSIRVWEVTATAGRVIQSVFAHEAAVIHLAYAGDGKTLYSLSEDRNLKAWDAERMVERKVYARQPEAALALAVAPDHKQLAVGRYDGALLLLEEATGKVQAQPLPVKPKAPEASKVAPAAGQRGQAIRLTFEGKHLDSVTELVAAHPGVTSRLLADGRSAGTLQVEVTFPATTPAGIYPLRLKGPLGETKPLSFIVDPFAQAAEKEPNNSPGTGQSVTLPATVVGTIDRAGDVDFYRFEAKAGQELGVQILTGSIGSKLEPFLELTDAAGRVLAESSDGLLGYTFTTAGTYALGVRDRDFRGEGSMHYRLHLGDLPVITAVYPLGLQRGTEAEIHLEGVYLGAGRSVRVKAPADAAPGTQLPLSVATPKGAPLGLKKVVVGEFPEVFSKESTVQSLAVPGTANGRISKPGATDTWRFHASKGQRLFLEVNARQLASALDSYIEILDAEGRPLPRATLRALAKTYVTFRDHDSAGAGIRIETWSELAMNDYIYAGTELLRIQELPPNPDADCTFFSDRGQRIGYLDTTPTHLSMGTPMYKVQIHPPGTTFPPNGFPVVTLYYRNDDGGPGFGRDSRLTFDPPADGDYQVRIGDARGQGGPSYAYRLTVRSPRPSYNVSFNPTGPAVWKGGAVPITVSAERIDGFDGPITVKLENVPPGFSAPATTIPAGENSTALALSAEASAMSPAKTAAPLNLTAEALIDARPVRREVTGGLPTAVEPGEIVTTTGQSEVTVQPGRQTRLTVQVERRKGFKGRIPLEVRGLPHGVRVLDVGLNGILITEQQTARTVVIYCEPWVVPTEHPFVVLARHEGSNRDFAARSVLLRIAGK